MVANETENRLFGIRLFDGVPRDRLDELERLCRWRSYAVNEKILDRDDNDSDVFFVATGAVLVVNYSQTGREIALAKISAGSYFGELAAIDGNRRSASVVALEKAVVGAMAPDVFRAVVFEDRELSMRVMQRLARIIRTCDDRIMDLSTLGAHQRVYNELLNLAKPDPAGTDTLVIWPMPAQKEIAGRVSTTRETVTRAISQLVADGIVERKQKSIYIRDLERLERLASALDPDWGEERAR